MTPGYLSADTQDLLVLLAKHEVRYLVVGGQAVIHHGYARLTGDTDLFYEQTEDNALRLFTALSEFWDDDIPSLHAVEELLEDDIVVQFGLPPNRVDLLSRLVGVPFATAWQRRVTESLRVEGQTVAVPIIGLPDLITNKRSVGRHKDLDDVEHLLPLLDDAS